MVVTCWYSAVMPVLCIYYIIIHYTCEPALCLGARSLVMASASRHHIHSRVRPRIQFKFSLRQFPNYTVHCQSMPDHLIIKAQLISQKRIYNDLRSVIDVPPPPQSLPPLMMTHPILGPLKYLGSIRGQSDPYKIQLIASSGRSSQTMLA